MRARFAVLVGGAVLALAGGCFETSDYLPDELERLEGSPVDKTFTVEDIEVSVLEANRYESRARPEVALRVVFRDRTLEPFETLFVEASPNSCLDEGEIDESEIGPTVADVWDISHRRPDHEQSKEVFEAWILAPTDVGRIPVNLSAGRHRAAGDPPPESPRLGVLPCEHVDGHPNLELSRYLTTVFLDLEELDVPPEIWRTGL